jgi:glycosyltransferase involved in cell wall biosynthesis
MLTVIILYSDDDIHYLKDCLSTVNPEWQLILVKTIQDDKCAIELIRHLKTTNNVIECDFTYKDLDLADIRNQAKKFATNEWILSLDADERLLIHQWELIEEACKQADKDTGGIVVNIVSCYSALLDAEHRPMTEVIKACRIFRNSHKINWYGAIHEVINTNFENLGLKVAYSSIKIDHLGYEVDMQGMVKKLERNFFNLWKHPELINAGGYYIDKMINSAITYKQLKEQI